MTAAKPITFDEIKPSPEAVSKVTAMAEEASRDDGWMQPTPEDHTGERNLGDMMQAHRDSWCDTDHFQMTYGDKLSDITDDEVIRLTGDINGLSHLDLGRYEGLYVPLRDIFWERWEELTGFVEKAVAARKPAREKR